MQFPMFVCRLAVALWVGGSALFTFLLTPAIFRNEKRDAAGRIVGYLFPGYFRWGLVCGGVALVALPFAGEKEPLLPGALLAAMLTLAAYQAWYVEPRAARLKVRIPSFETTPKDDPLRREFSRLHAVSALCNLAVVFCGVALVALV